MKQKFKLLALILLVALPLGCSSASKSTGSVAAKETPPPVVQAPASTTPGVAQPGAPMVELTETSFDFGKVREGEDYLHDFKVKNVGSGLLEIKKVLPG